MAKKKAGGPNKSQSIRDFKNANPDMKPKQIAEELGKKGVKVSAGFVSTILSTTKKKKSVGKPGRPKGSGSATTKRSAGRPAKKSDSVSVDSLFKVKQIVDEVGGISKARNALVALEQLMD